MSDGEKESAERFFIRYYQDRPEQELPQRYPGMQCFGNECLYIDVHTEDRAHKNYVRVEVRLTKKNEIGKKNLTKLNKLSNQEQNCFLTLEY